MRQTLLAAAVLAALAAPASAEDALSNSPPLVRLFEVVTDPAAFEGTRQEVRCHFRRANLTLAMCVVFNMSGEHIGDVPVIMRHLPADSRRHLVNNCTGEGVSAACTADMMADILADPLGFRNIEIVWHEAEDGH